MSSSQPSVSEEVLQLVARCTRACQFDFDQAAAQVNTHLTEVNALPASSHYSVHDVRQMFAASMKLSQQKKSTAQATEPNVRPSRTVVEDSEDSSESNNTEVVHSDENLTFAEVFKRAQERQIENDKLKEAMFQRVLSSLEISDANEVVDLATSLKDEHREVLKAMALREEQQQMDRFKEAKQLEEEEEQKQLNEQREALRYRFNPDSEDSVGLDPLQDMKSCVSQDTLHSAPSKRSLDDVDRDTKLIKSNTNDIGETPTVTAFNLDQLLNTVEFDSLLTDIERDLDRQAQGKDGTEPLSEDNANGEASELGEVLDFLNKVASERPQKDTPITLPQPPPSSTVSSDKSGEDDSLVADRKELKSKTFGELKSDISEFSSVKSSETVRLKPSDSSRPPPGVGSRSGRDSMAYGGRGGKGRGAKASSNSRDNGQGEMESPSGSDSDSDNDDNWRTMRHKLKAADQNITSSGTRNPVQPVWTGSSKQLSTKSDSGVFKEKVSSLGDSGEISSESDEEEEKHKSDTGEISESDKEGDEKDYKPVKIEIESVTESDTCEELNFIPDHADNTNLRLASSEQCVDEKNDSINLKDDFESEKSLQSMHVKTVAIADSVIPPPIPPSSLVHDDVHVKTSVANSASTSVSEIIASKNVQGGILSSSGRDRSRKGKNKQASSRMDAARKRREQKLLDEEIAEQQRLALLEKQREEAIEKELQILKEKESNRESSDQSCSDDNEDDGGVANKGAEEVPIRLTPHDAFPDPGIETYFPFLTPNFSDIFKKAFDETTKGSVVTKDAHDLGNSLVVVQCEVSSSKVGALFSSCDEWIYTTLAWLIEKQDEMQARIIGTTLTNGSVDFLAESGSRSLYVVMEGYVPNTNQFMAETISHIIKITEVLSVLPSLTLLDDEMSLSDMLKVLSIDQSISILHNIISMPFSESAESGHSIVAGASWTNHVNQNSLTSCVFKDYFFGKAVDLESEENTYSQNFRNVFQSCERSGLRLCGLRTAYVPVRISESENSKRISTNVSKYIHKSIMTPNQSACSREDCNLVLVACFYTPRFVASEQMRNLLGPEDVMLAKRTDPLSIRARFSNVSAKRTDGNSRIGSVNEKNVAFPMAIQTANCWRETLFWFGPRYTGVSKTSNVASGGNMSQAALVVPSERIIVLGVALECVDDDFISNAKESMLRKASIVSNELAIVQKDVVKKVQVLSSDSMKILTLWSVGAEEFVKYGLVCSEGGTDSNQFDTVPPSSYLVFLFKTSSSDMHLNDLKTHFREFSLKRTSHAQYWSVNVTLKVRKSFQRYVKPALLNDVKLQIAQSEVAGNLLSSSPQGVSNEHVDRHGKISQLLEEEDFDSHEDVGLQDVVVVGIPLLLKDDAPITGAKGTVTSFGPVIPPQELSLHLLDSLPTICHCTVLGVFSSVNDVNHCINNVNSVSSVSSSSETKYAYLCLRGLHLVESISDALQLSIERISTAACTGGGLLPNIAFDARAKLLRIPKSSDFKVFKGKRALDIVSKCFLNVDSCGRNQDKIAENIDCSNFSNFFAECDLENFVPSLSNKTRGALSVQALFPPGRFTSLSVVVIPYPREIRGSGKGVGSQGNGLFVKVFKKLEKAGFDIMGVSSKVVDVDMATFCREHVMQSQGCYGCSYDSNEVLFKEWFDALVGKEVLAVVVSGNSALLRLIPVIGPFDTLVAEDKYPLSISATLHVSQSSYGKVDLDLSSIARIFHSTTVAATDTMLKHFSNHFYSTVDLLHAQSESSALSDTNSSGQVVFKNLLSDFGSMEHYTYQQRYDSPPKPSKSVGNAGAVEHAVYRGLRQISLKDHDFWIAKQQDSICSIREILSSSSNATSSSTTINNVDVTCIVLTNALLCRVGLSAILQAVYKEGLKVVQARSELLHITVAKKLLELAGQSSLSMKPSLSVLMDGPVLYLALEGNSHVILRLKSILQQPVGHGGTGLSSLHMNVYNPRGLEDAKQGAGIGSHSSLGHLGEDEWGLLASSSSRLSRDLLLYCFNCDSSQLVSNSLSIVEKSKKDVELDQISAPYSSSSSELSSASLSSVSNSHTSSTSTLLSSPVTSPSSVKLEDVEYHTPKTGSPLGLGGLGSAFGGSPKFFTPPTSQKAGKEYEEVKGETARRSVTALEELD